MANAEDKTELESFESKIKNIEKPKKVLSELCRQSGKILDFCCLLKINENSLDGWVFHSKTPMPDFDIAEIKFRTNDIEGLASNIERNVPLQLENMDHKNWQALLDKRKLSKANPVVFYPVLVGQKTPFVFLAETNENFNAEAKGYLNRWITSTGMRLSALILERRQKKQDFQQPKKVRSNFSRLMAENWVSAYSEVKQNQRWKTRTETITKSKITPHLNKPIELEVSDTKGIN